MKNIFNFRSFPFKVIDIIVLKTAKQILGGITTEGEAITRGETEWFKNVDRFILTSDRVENTFFMSKKFQLDDTLV